MKNNEVALLSDQIKEKLGSSKFVVVSNREPYIHREKKDEGEEYEIEWVKPASGLTIALDPVMQACGGTWIAHGSGEADREVVDELNRIPVPPDEPKYILRRIWLNKKEEEGYYYGFSNQGLWPLSHNAWIKPIFSRKDWEYYKTVNNRFTRVVLNEIKKQPAFIALQDYHLALCAKGIKEKRADIPLGLFWHIPWPNPEAFLICPWNQELLEGLLSNDLLGFQIKYYCDNFLATVDRVLESRIDYETSTVSYKGHETLVRPFPISIDFDFLSRQSEQIQPHQISQIKGRFRGEIIGIGVDRIDYTKGIPERLLAVKRFLEKYPQYQGKFVFLQIGAPSREHIDAYIKVSEEIDRMVGMINYKYSSGKYRPIRYEKRFHTLEEEIPLYKLSDLGIVSPLHDGMNLVAKEYVAAKVDSNGPLILSKFAGAARELTDALLINPYNTEEFADAIKYAIEMPEEEKQRRMERMRETIRKNDIYNWANSFISELTEIKRQI